jgi:putative peptidoglycan lipid II flippase
MSNVAQPSVHRRVFASTAIVMGGILLSRVLGFFREWTVAHQVGSNALTDAYYAAFTLPDFLNYLIAGASLSVTFIPVFTKYAAEDREDEAWWVFSTVMTFMGLMLIGLVILGEIFAPQLARAIAPGFGPQEKRQVVFLTRLMLPAQFCFYEGSILSAVQYAKGQFVIPSLAPVLYNVMIILGGVLLASRIGMTGFAVGVLVGAFAGNFLFQVWGAYRADARYTPNLNLRHPGFKLFLRLSIPIMLALSLTFTDDWIIRFFGSYLQPASITWLSYAKTLMRVPLGVVGQGVGVASFPYLSRLYSEGKFDELNRLLNSTLKGIIAVLVPISALTIAESGPLVYLVFSHTRMSAYDLNATAATMGFFSLGMFAWGAQYILARGFYATRNTMVPAIVGTVLTFANLPMYWVLVHRYQHLGLAMASSLGITVYTVSLFFLLNRRVKNREAGAMMLFFLKVCGASAAVAIACRQLQGLLEPYFAWHRFTGAFLLLAIVTAAGTLLLILLGKLLRIRELDEQIARLWLIATGNRQSTAP